MKNTKSYQIAKDMMIMNGEEKLNKWQVEEVIKMAILEGSCMSESESKIFFDEFLKDERSRV